MPSSPPVPSRTPLCWLPSTMRGRPRSTRRAPSVGEHLGAEAEPDVERVVTHRFASLAPGYRGWVWAVTLSRVSRGKTITVDEVVQLPGDGALLAPAWLPWSDRLQPGDLGPGDLLPTAPDDPRLVPGYQFEADDEPEVLDVVRELGLGRVRVLSPEGRDDAADRWVNGAGGPQRRARRGRARRLRDVRLPGPPRRRARARCSVRAPTSGPPATGSS